MTEASSQLNALLGQDWRDEVDRRRTDLTGRIGGRSSVLLFGAGYLGQHVLRDLAGLPFKPEAFVDNNPALWGKMVQGLQVVGPQDAVARYGQSALWLITVYTNSAVMEQCRALGVPWVTCAELSWTLPLPHPTSLIFGLPETLVVSAREIEEADTLWADAESRAEYRAQVRWRFLLEYSGLVPPRPTVETYFPGDLIVPLEDEVFVDCGAFTGDTIEAFVESRDGKFKEVVAVEPDAFNQAALQDRLSALTASGSGSYRVAPLAAGAKRGVLSFSATGTAGSTVGSGTDSVEVAPLDEILKDTGATYIKFDVEGAEHDALVGGAETIRASMPVLAVCVYHKPEDVWDIPLLINSLNRDYKLYLRRYSDERWETVCYAVPPDRLKG